MKISPKTTAVVQPKDVVVWSFSAESLPQSQEVRNSHKVDFEHLINPENNLIHQIPMEVKIESVSEIEPSFKLSISTSAFFEFNPDCEADAIAHMIVANCIPMTYSAIRGLVLSLTAAMAFGPVTIPSVNFVELMKQKARRQAKKSV